VEYWDEKYQARLNEGFKIGDRCPPDVKERAISLVKKYWDCFYNEGPCIPIRRFEFIIDT
jgi:hypothetical protein